jgi:hypothetical protein
MQGGEKEEMYLQQIMIPQARELLLRIAQTNDLPSTTNQVQSYKVDYFDDGLLAGMQLTNGWVFRFLTDKRETNVSALHLPGKMEEVFLKETLIPVAQEYLLRIGQTNDLPFTTNQVRSYKVHWFDDRPGCTADIVLTNRWVFEFTSGSTVLPGGKTTRQWGETEVRRFQRPIKTYYNLVGVPKEKIEAVKALNLQNKLNKNTALVLARKYFKLLGHHDGNFYQPEITQCYWSGGEDGRGGILPYYEVSWYRKDVNLADQDKGITNLPEVLITVSGVDSSLLYYSRLYLPIGNDF